MSMNGPGGQPPSPYDPPPGGQPPASNDPAAGNQPPSPYAQPGSQPQPYPASPQGPVPQQGYPGSPYQPYATPFPKNSLGVWSLVLGIVSVAMCLGLLSGIPAIIVGHKARQAVREGQADNDGLALAGIITGWVGTALVTLFWIVYIGIIVFAVTASDSPSTYTY